MTTLNQSKIIEGRLRVSEVVDPTLGTIPPELLALDGERDVKERLPTLTDRGKMLPIGFVDQHGIKHRDFDLAKWTWDTEERLGQLAEDEPGLPINQYVSEVIGHGLSRIGTVDLMKMKRSWRRLLVRSFYFSDALYVYVWIRIHALGHGLRLRRFQCQTCRTWIDGYVGDLRTLEVKAFEEVPRRTVKLEHGVTYAGKQLHVFHVGPLRWAFLEDADVATLSNPAKFRLATLQQAIVGLDGAPEGPVHLTAEHLRTMLPREVNALVAEVDRCNGGVVMEVVDECPRCREEFHQDLDWSYPNFFETSSP